MNRVGATLLLASALCLSLSCADVGSLSRFTRPGPRRLTSHFQRQQLNPTPYPSAGFRPERQFPLPADTASSQEAPAEANVDVVALPELTYGAPARLRQFPARQQQLAAPQLTYGAPEAPEAEAQASAAAQPARLTAPKSARLTADREEREDREQDIDEPSGEAEVEVGNVAPKAVAPQATVAYFPAGAVSFVQPVAAAKFFAKLPAQTAAYAVAPAAQLSAAPAAYTQPQIYANSPYFQPQFAYAAAPAQLSAW